MPVASAAPVARSAGSKAAAPRPACRRSPAVTPASSHRSIAFTRRTAAWAMRRSTSIRAASARTGRTMSNQLSPSGEGVYPEARRYGQTRQA